MMKFLLAVRAIIAGFVGLLIVFITPASATTVLLEVDLSVTNQITITATDGASAATVSGSDGLGVLLAGIFGAPLPEIDDFLVTGNLTSAQDTSDGSPNLFVSDGGPGLNIFSFTDDPSFSFIAGETAFTGSATFNIGNDVFLNLLAGPGFGNIFAPADGNSDIPSATLIGQFNVLGVGGVPPSEVPLPAAAWMFIAGVGGLRAMRRKGSAHNAYHRSPNLNLR